MPPKMETASGYLERKGAASMENLKTDNEKRKYKTLLAADNARVKAATAHEIELKRAENGMLDEEELKDLKKGKDLDDADERIGDRLTKEETDEMSKAQIKEYYDDLKAEKLRKQQNGGGSDGESSESPFEPDEASGSSESDNSVDSEVSEDVDEALDLAVKSTRKEVKADLKKEKKKKKKEKEAPTKKKTKREEKAEIKKRSAVAGITVPPKLTTKDGTTPPEAKLSSLPMQILLRRDVELGGAPRVGPLASEGIHVAELPAYLPLFALDEEAEVARNYATKLMARAPFTVEDAKAHEARRANIVPPGTKSRYSLPVKLMLVRNSYGDPATVTFDRCKTGHTFSDEDKAIIDEFMGKATAFYKIKDALLKAKATPVVAAPATLPSAYVPIVAPPPAVLPERLVPRATQKEKKTKEETPVVVKQEKKKSPEIPIVEQLVALSDEALTTLAKDVATVSASIAVASNGVPLPVGMFPLFKTTDATSSPSKKRKEPHPMSNVTEAAVRTVLPEEESPVVAPPPLKKPAVAVPEVPSGVLLEEEEEEVLPMATEEKKSAPSAEQKLYDEACAHLRTFNSNKGEEPPRMRKEIDKATLLSYHACITRVHRASMMDFMMKNKMAKTKEAADWLKKKLFKLTDKKPAGEVLKQRDLMDPAISKRPKDAPPPPTVEEQSAWWREHQACFYYGMLFSNGEVRAEVVKRLRRLTGHEETIELLEGFAVEWIRENKKYSQVFPKGTLSAFLLSCAIGHANEWKIEGMQSRCETVFLQRPTTNGWFYLACEALDEQFHQHVTVCWDNLSKA